MFKFDPESDNIIEAFDPVIYKNCKKCGNSKLIEEFHKDLSQKDGKYPKCKDCVCTIQRDYYHRNSIKEKSRSSSNERRRYHTDLNFRIKHNQRSAMSKLMRGKIKKVKWLGCDSVSFFQYIETTFEPGMTWTNRGKGAGKWELDHILHQNRFDCTREDHRMIIFNWQNLRARWSKENNKDQGHEFGQLTDIQIKNLHKQFKLNEI